MFRELPFASLSKRASQRVRVLKTNQLHFADPQADVGLRVRKISIGSDRRPSEDRSRSTSTTHTTDDMSTPWIRATTDD